MEAKQQRGWIGGGLIGFVCVALLALVGRLAYLYAEDRDQLLDWSEPRQVSTVHLPAARGAILDRRYRVLAGSHDMPTAFVDPSQLEDVEKAVAALAKILDLSADEIRQAVTDPTSPEYVVLQRSLTDEQAEAVRKLEIRGVGVHDEPVRSYPNGSLAAHILGFVGKDGAGLEGIELRFEEYLRAHPGKRQVYRDKHRRATSQKPDSYVPPRDGVHVVLTLDAAIQGIVETAVRKQVEEFKAEHGLGVVMDPKTGEILALANYPTFDLESPGYAPVEARRNRVLTDPVEPGSIFKSFIMASALAEGVTWPTESIFCENGLYITGKRYLHDHHSYGNLTTTEVLAFSSNIGMAKLGQRLGNKRMYEALRALGFGGPTGIDLPGEDAGLLMPLNAWNSYSTTSVPMGQEVAVTPIQIATAFSTLVNGGRLIKPRVVRAVVDRHGDVIEDRSRTVDRGQVLTERDSAAIRQLLTEVVVNKRGTGRRCDIDKWQVMGKTGTAQVPKQGSRGYEPNAYLGSFVAAAPASDPAVVALVMVRKPDRKIGYYGGTVALPAVKSIMEQTLAYLNIPPDKPVEN